MKSKNNLKPVIEEFKRSMMDYAMHSNNEYVKEYWNFFFDNAETFHMTLSRNEYEELKEKLIFVKPKECYDNAISWCVISKGKYRYYEGFSTGFTQKFLVEHAWNVEDSKVFDLTLYKDLEELDEKLRERVLNNREVDYIGVNIPYENIKKYLDYETECKPKTLLQYFFEEKTGGAKYETI
jgi:hypothetical protein